MIKSGHDCSSDSNVTAAIRKKDYFDMLKDSRLNQKSFFYT